jgi:hypothetical protein
MKEHCDAHLRLIANAEVAIFNIQVFYGGENAGSDARLVHRSPKSIRQINHAFYSRSRSISTLHETPLG